MEQALLLVTAALPAGAVWYAVLHKDLGTTGDLRQEIPLSSQQVFKPEV